MNNYEKYIKYKKKYLELKKELIIGGSGNYTLPIPKKISTNNKLPIQEKISNTTNYPLPIPKKITNMNKTPTYEEVNNYINTTPTYKEVNNYINTKPTYKEVNNNINTKPTYKEVNNNINTKPTYKEVNNNINTKPTYKEVNNYINTKPTYKEVNNYINTKPTYKEVNNNNINTKPTLFLPNKPAEKVSETRYIRPNNNIYVETEYNSGGIDGMINQCFWMSIHQFLLNNGYPNLTVREIRTNAGLNRDTEDKMFDSEIEEFRKAAEVIARKYNLTINIVPVNSHGQVLYGGNLIERIGNGINNVNIAQFGTHHFQLITNYVDNLAESNFIPAVVIDNNIVDINYNNLSDINEQKLNIKIALIDLELEIKSYKNTLESFRSDYLNYKQLKEQSTDPKEIDNITNMARGLEKLYKETETKLKECENTKLNYEYILTEL